VIDSFRGLQTTLRLNRCPYCHDHVEAEESLVCQGCLARHHSGCWEEHGTCASCGEGVALGPREASRVSRPGRHPLEHTPTPLAGSRISVERLEDGIRISYPGQRRLAANRPDGTAAGLGLTFAFAFSLLGGFIGGEDFATGGSVVVSTILGALLAGLPFLIVGLWGLRRLRRDKSEPPLLHLDLAADRIKLDRPHPWRRTRAELIDVPATDVGNLQLKDGTLTIDLGAHRIPLATCLPWLSNPLSGPETEWLYGVLKRWRNTDPSPLGDPEPGTKEQPVEKAG
jgi:hypothetical protein